MNRTLRVRHRWSVSALAVIVPLLFAAGLAARREMPVSAAVNGSGTEAAWSRVSELRVSFPDRGTVSFEWLESDDPAARLGFRLRLTEVALPEVLVYHAPHGAGQDALPAGARLLGRVTRGVAGPWPFDGDPGEPGWLILFLPARNEVLHSFRLHPPRTVGGAEDAS